jgi:hypothetical protein
MDDIFLGLLKHAFSFVDWTLILELSLRLQIGTFGHDILLLDKAIVYTNRYWWRFHLVSSRRWFFMSLKARLWLKPEALTPIYGQSTTLASLYLVVVCNIYTICGFYSINAPCVDCRSRRLHANCLRSRRFILYCCLVNISSVKPRCKMLGTHQANIRADILLLLHYDRRGWYRRGYWQAVRGLRLMLLVLNGNRRDVIEGIQLI